MKNCSPIWHWRCDHIPSLEGEVSLFSTFNKVLLPQVNSIRFLPYLKKVEWLHFNKSILKPNFCGCQFLPIYEMRVSGLLLKELYILSFAIHLLLKGFVFYTILFLQNAWLCCVAYVTKHEVGLNYIWLRSDYFLFQKVKIKSQF